LRAQLKCEVSCGAASRVFICVSIGDWLHAPLEFRFMFGTERQLMMKRNEIGV
jgi:hypothetical protein